MNERPFVSVKRAYEYRKYNDSQVSTRVHLDALSALIARWNRAVVSNIPMDRCAIIPKYFM